MFLDGLVGDAHVGAEFLNRHGLVGGFVKGIFDFQDKVPALTFAFSGDTLDVFWIDAHAVDPGLHGRRVWIIKGKQFPANGVFWHPVPLVRSRPK